MTMFARLKHQPLEPIQWLVALNIAIASGLAVKASALSPVMTGFSILAAVSAALAFYLLRIRIASAAPTQASTQRPETAPATQSVAANSIGLPKDNPMNEIAGLPTSIKPAAFSQQESAEKISLRRLEEALRRLANGETSILLHEEFPEGMDGLRFQFNRLASTLQINLLPTGRAAALLRDNAYRAQSTIALVSARMEKMLTGSKALAEATVHLGTNLKDAHAEAERLSRRNVDALARTSRIEALRTDLAEQHAASLSAGQHLHELSRRMSDLAIRAEQFASNPERHGAAFRRSHASDCVAFARDYLQACHELSRSLEGSIQNLRQLKHEQHALAEALEEQSHCASKLCTTLDQESHRIALSQTVAREIASVTSRLSPMAEDAEAQLMKIMSQTTTIETRLSMFKTQPTEKTTTLKPTKAPHLRCVT
ncbi:hypothetical protein MUU53_14320 [Rhizobium lemnae]|uniref:Methyl-accepting chemotaxis protein n=1 Tax=Rhizobium lemnae TaxID=1214924 RepID=A0ABV8ECE0_9HYPH|nr:hypothetical protein [Rhizobium lemnae]MCJ8509089.1 hypothetical protein [Rhizobium lemnae]